MNVGRACCGKFSLACDILFTNGVTESLSFYSFLNLTLTFRC